MSQSDDRFILEFKGSGNKWHFNTNTALEQRLEKIEDKYGNALTFQYESPSGRLTNVVDAIGRYFQFRYNGDGYVTNVSDAFGRSAVFAYSGRDLVSMTDMGGLTTTIQYDTNHWPTNVNYPSGQSWKVEYTTGMGALYDDYSPPFRMRVVDPLMQTNEYFYHAFDYMGPITVKDNVGNNWLFASKTIGGDGGAGGAQRTYYSGVNATAAPYSGVSDQRLHRTYDANANAVELAVANQPNAVGIGYNDNEGARAVDVLTTNLFDANRNLLSATVLTNDTYQWTGLQVFGTWTNAFDANDNLIWTRNPLDQTNRYGYDAQDHLTAATNALGYFTLMTYDHNGNLTNLVDALRRTNRWTYDANGRNYETLYNDGLRLSRGYDPVGRVNAVTNHGSGLYLSYFYDNLNRMRDVKFPDGTTNHFEYSCCGLDWTRDRLNRTTYYGRDALGRTTSVTDPQNRLTEFRYNGADQITNLITHVGGETRTKRFAYTATNGASRLTQVTTPMGKLLKYDYTFRGGLAWRQDGNGNITKFQYDPLGRLVSVTDNDNSPLVEMAYDVLGNVTHVASTNSVFDYSYDPLNRATNAVCLLTNLPGFATVKYQIAYQFDPVGNVTNRVITGLQGLTESITTRYQYDTMNRLTNVVQLTNAAATASAWYSYDAAGRLWKKGYGNGDVVTHSYDTESRLLSLGITNNTTPVWWYRYGWDNGGNILAITNNGTNVSLYGYDRAGQLTNEVSLTNGIAGGTTNAWVYDEAGNWRTGDGKWRLYNADNELVGIATSNAPVSVPITVTGEVSPGPQSNKWYNTWASSRGVSAQVSQTNGTFSLANVPLYPGTNDLVVTVTDVSGNTTQQVRTVSRPLPETFRYDGNGNLTNWISGTTNWVYEWDSVDRLTKATSNGIVVQENWYDAFGRRVAKNELANGQTIKRLYQYAGYGVTAVADASGQVLETFARRREVVKDIGTIVAVTHHPGSTTNGAFYTHYNHRGDLVLARNGTATVGSYGSTAFGNLKGITGTDVCRFRFSSKERDSSTGFLYFGYRLYAPQWQRWLNSDPVRERGGLNLFGFVRNDPITVVDALGLNFGNPFPPVVTFPAPNRPAEDKCEVDGAAEYLSCWVACMMRDILLEIGVEGGGDTWGARQWYVRFSGDGRFRHGKCSKVLVPRLAKGICALAWVRTAFGAWGCAAECGAFGDPPPPPPPGPPYSGGPHNMPPVMNF
jgi:RHS repeat-associated protein